MLIIEKNCPHVDALHTTIDYVKNTNKERCTSCDYAGPNLWLCLKPNCIHLGCSEQALDHSTEHFLQNNSHCIHLNLSSFRMWCYLCECEIIVKQKPDSVENRLNGCENSFQFPLLTNSTSGLVGLQNIANTCYMNSALQALSNITPMTQYFIQCVDLIEHRSELSSYRSKGGLAKSYSRLMQDIWCKNRDDKKYIAPLGILYEIRSVHPIFQGFQQHDSQEFLRCFMDQIHEELKEPESISFKISTIDKQELISDSEQYYHSNSLSESEYETCESSASADSKKLIASLTSKRVFNKRKQSCKLQEHEKPKRYQQQNVNKSVITEIFDGKLLSSVECLTCDRISTREETFQDLSLPIPTRDYLNMIHNTHSLSSQNINIIDQNSRQNKTWISWIRNILSSWLWGPSITLHDCMASFFSADELKGDNMYSCEKCNKLRTGVKYSQILSLPEVLCIHLKRFRHDIFYSSKISSHIEFPLEGFDMQPYLHKNCKSKILYDLVSVICHHGTVGSGHYTCFARNNLTKKWYEYDDQQVTEISKETVQNCQAYVLFYQKSFSRMEFIRSKASQLSQVIPNYQSDIRFYVARDWMIRFYTFAEPGPINNWTLLCPHGGIMESKINFLKQFAVPINQKLWDFLYKNFGGGPAINMLYECEICKQSAQCINNRQLYELSMFSKYNVQNDAVDSSSIYAISMPWLRKWQEYARGKCFKEPGPITNNSIINLNESIQGIALISNVRKGSDYAQINGPLWRFFHGIYGGGPEILLKKSFTNIGITNNDNITDTDNFSETESRIGQQCESNIGKDLDNWQEQICNNAVFNDERFIKNINQNEYDSNNSDINDEADSSIPVQHNYAIMEKIIPSRYATHQSVGQIGNKMLHDKTQSMRNVKQKKKSLRKNCTTENYDNKNLRKVVYLHDSENSTDSDY